MRVINLSPMPFKRSGCHANADVQTRAVSERASERASYRRGLNVNGAPRNLDYPEDFNNNPERRPATRHRALKCRF
jgi:hypothetical protein